MVAKFHAIKPKPLNDTAMSKELRDASNKFTPYVIKGRDDVTTGWEGARPKWRVVRYWANQYQIGFQIDMDENSEGGKKWVWLDLGTKGPYPIPKTGTANLAFPSVYHAGSRPGQIRTYRASSGGPMWFPKKVMHPGIKARGWSKILQKDEQIMYERWMMPAMAKAARASGHAMEK